MKSHLSILTALAALSLAATGCEKPANPSPEKAAAEEAAQAEATAKAGAAAEKAAADLEKQGADAPAPKAAAEPAKPTPEKAAAAPTPDAPPSFDAPPDVKAPPANAEKTASGLASIVLKPGDGGAKPTAEAVVEVHYTGWQSSDGKMFDSSVKRGQTTKFPLNRVIKGWTEGLQLMTKGEKRRFWIPAGLAYGDKPMRPGAPAGQLVFDVELFGFQEPPKVEAPADVAAAPADAKKTASGLAYKVITPGKGDAKPSADSMVRVHYSGWTTDGKLFDSSVKRGQPATFPLNAVIKGWTEGVQLMTVGEKTRFWIPAEMAYGEKPKRPGAPAGLLVFDIELLEIMGK